MMKSPVVIAGAKGVDPCDESVREDAEQLYEDVRRAARTIWFSEAAGDIEALKLEQLEAVAMTTHKLALWCENAYCEKGLTPPQSRVTLERLRQRLGLAT